MLDSLANILQTYPALAIFLTVGLGFLIGKIRIGNFSLGSVTSVLLVGILIGQLDIPMSGPIKMVFFLMFLFSIGYSVGPDFFKSLKGSGLKQALFAVIMSACCFGATLGLACWMGYTKGESVGMFAGSQTCSSIIGVGGEALERLGGEESWLKKNLAAIPICYAVTYIFGTLGTVIILGNFGPRLLGGMPYVRERTLKLERDLTGAHSTYNPAAENAMRVVDYRAYRASSDFFSEPRMVEEVEHYLHTKGLDVYIDRIRHNNRIWAPNYDDKVYPGDELVICGPAERIIALPDHIGEELIDSDLLGYPLERVGVVAARKGFFEKYLSEIHKKKWMHGVVIRDAMRDGKMIDVKHDTIFRKGDRLTLIGQPALIAEAARHIGHLDRPSIASDLMFVGLAIFIGGLFGALSVWIGSIPLSFGTSGGALIAGLVFGWLRSRRPTYGNIAPGALWLMNNLGLNVFIAVVGLESATQFVSGLKEVGPMLFVVGAFATMIPVFIGLWLGQKVFKFNPAITLGCCAGTRTCTAALGAVQNALGSTIPVIGYTVTYAVSNILLILWGLLLVILI